MPNQSFDVVVVGAGHAGPQATIFLRQGGYAGSILIIGAETEWPYERPPLSKHYLSNEKTAERLLLRPIDFWAKQNIEMLQGVRVDAVDAVNHHVRTSTDQMIGYGSLIWAAGGFARPLLVTGGDLAGVHVIRTRAQVDLLKQEAEAAKNIVIIGGGYIGLEAAAALNKLGKNVSLVEAQERVLSRVTCPLISRFFEAEHRAHGVDLRLGTGVDSIEGHERVSAVRLANGEVLAADLVISGIGLVPSVAPLAEAGAICNNGADVDEFCQTNLPDVYAIGDCAHHINAFASGGRVRLESVQNANDQAKVVAGVLLGKPLAYHAVPWFWSNQYDLTLQTAGLYNGYDETVLRGDPATRAFSVVYYRQGQIIALDCVNSAADYMAGRVLIEQAACTEPSLVADKNIPLKKHWGPRVTA